MTTTTKQQTTHIEHVINMCHHHMPKGILSTQHAMIGCVCLDDNQISSFQMPTTTKVVPLRSRNAEKARAAWDLNDSNHRVGVDKKEKKERISQTTINNETVQGGHMDRDAK